MDPSAEGLVSYRSLTREDFRASEPPPRADASRGHVAAATCVFLAQAPGVKFRARSPGKGQPWTAEVLELAFVARMDPSCSWWDAESRFRPDAYVLEHEQIHFAIVELEARDLNRRAASLSASLESTGATGQEALEAIRDRFADLLRDAQRRVLERSARFDAETSLGFRPEAQAGWAETVEAELAIAAETNTDE